MDGDDRRETLRSVLDATQIGCYSVTVMLTNGSR
jgi:hypothetical protein